ncbi:MAG: hypothetical protein MSG64_04955 [Pyrinomonadaceae bacterium MAG19_C2-C3]|nr:hypothetical protein [Pyrinomonadaceae bacterium MAG19_C2-C3]
MSELDAEWERVRAEVERRARERGQGDVADYFHLRATNDAARKIGIDWLLNMFTRAAGEANRRGATINLEESNRTSDRIKPGDIPDTHRFTVGASTMVGVRCVMRVGIKTLTVEAGYPRTPTDGFIRGGGLARANITHFGDKRAGQKLMLVQRATDAPGWFVIEDDDAGVKPGAMFAEADIARHLIHFAKVS